MVQRGAPPASSRARRGGDPDATETGTILCFLVARADRGQGIARLLLNAACATFSAQGLRYAEANPRPRAATSAENHFGPLSMYLAAGFSVRSTDADGSVWVRKVLARQSRD